MIKKYVFVYVPGTWDLFHVGHLRLLKKASGVAHNLIVGIDTDKAVKRDKGEFPIIPYKERAELLKACQYVKKVTWNNHTVPSVGRLRKLGAEAVILADCWRNKYLTGKEEARREGIKIVYFPYTKSTSTTKIKEKIRTGVEK